MHTLKEYKRVCKNAVVPGKRVKIALLGDTATQLLATSIRGEALLRGYNVELWEADYNQIELQVMNPTSELHVLEADYVVVFQSTHKLAERHAMMSDIEQSRLAVDRMTFVRTLCSTVKSRIIYYNYPLLDDTVYGSYAIKVENSLTSQVTRLNYELMLLSREQPNLFICDMAGLYAKYGRNFMFDAPVYVNTEMILSIDALPVVASRTVDIISAAEGNFKKCLIVDLDNTLWGGVVGDDGWEGIELGHGLGIGKAFTELQQWIRKLRQRGVIIAVCSKNDCDKAQEPFLRNPEMVLRLDDIAMFVANWNNKVDNIKYIQHVINIGFDSMVFLDDNPFERNMVRENIEGITVPELPEDPGEYLEYLYSLNLFETASSSAGDNDRTAQYQAEARRVAAQQSFTDEGAFLRSLNMVSTVNSFNNYNMPRVAQLSQRSNQFNLRTVRYTEADVQAMATDSDCATFAFTLSDKFGDNGLICVIIMRRRDSNTMFIDTWLMSCRVLKRGMEHFALNTIVEHARREGYRYIEGEYIATAKNTMVANLYPSLGFSPAEDGTNCYVLDIDAYTPHECYIMKE